MSSPNKPNLYIDHDDSVLYLVTWGNNRQFFMPGHSEKEVTNKVRAYFEANFHLVDPVLDLMMKTVKLERTQIEWLT